MIKKTPKINQNIFPVDEIPKIGIEAIVKRALEEDLITGDVTSVACIDPEVICTALAVARQDLIVCGNAVAQATFAMVDPEIRFEVQIPDGVVAKVGQTLWKVSGRARAICMAERIALNFIQRMSGIATMTDAYVKAIPEGYYPRITNTRKTTPGLRALECYAVRIGGGYNHRINLGNAILIKDNHIIACGGISKAIMRARAYAPHTCTIECEVETLDQLHEALSAHVDIVLLDNMEDPMIAKAVKIAKGKALIEASGGITLARIPIVAQIGVDIISVGALTHSVRAVDIGLDFVIANK